MSALNEADTRAKLLDPAVHAREWTEDLIKREQSAGGITVRDGKARRTTRRRMDYLLRVQVKPTETIWYYDLSDVKVGKKTPLTLTQFDDFFAKLPGREDSERSWTVDLTARKEKAAEDARPHRAAARSAADELEVQKQKLALLKKARPKDEAAIGAVETCAEQLKKAVSEATKEADAIEAAVYDLKAVNPNRKANTDTRTPAELLDLIAAKGREIDAACAALWAMTAHREDSGGSGTLHGGGWG